MDRKPALTSFGARVFCFVAIGGMGKSALTWKWFNQIAPNEMKPLAGRMWWSFYESDATFENFMNRALCYVSGQSEDEVRPCPGRSVRRSFCSTSTTSLISSRSMGLNAS